MSALRTLSNPLGSRQKSAARSPRPRSSLAATIRADKRVLHLDVEETDGWFITLRAGWKYSGDPLMPTHCFGASTLTEAMREIRAALPCQCDQCKAEMANT